MLPFSINLIIFTLLSHLAPGITAAPTCGLIGTSNDTVLPVYMGNFFYRGPTTFALCASYCKNAAPRCQSFRYSYWSDADAQYCEFYEYGLEGNVIADDTQPYWYYDIDCEFPPYAETTISTTTATAAVQTVQQISTQTQIQIETVTSTSIPPAVTQTQTRTISQIQTATVTRTSIPSASTATVTSTLVRYQTQVVLQQRTITFTSTRYQMNQAETQNGLPAAHHHSYSLIMHRFPESDRFSYYHCHHGPHSNCRRSISYCNADCDIGK